MAAKILPDQAYLAECFSYDPDIGTLTWRERPREHFKSDHDWRSWNTQWLGRRAGCIKLGRRQIGFSGRYWHAQRIIWKLVTGDEPAEIIDHKNGDATDDRWVNLRAAVENQNRRNRRLNVNSGTGAKGTKRLPSGNFQARIMANGKAIYLGTFATKEAAHAAYCEAAERLHGEFWSAG